MDHYSVFVIDPDRLFREGIKRILDESTYRTVGEARSLGEAGSALQAIDRVDLIIVDIDDWESEATADFFQELRLRIGEVRIVVLTSHASRSSIAKAVGWSVDGYLMKDMSPEALSRSLQLVMLGQQVFPTRLMASLLHAGPSDQSADIANGASRGLSPREVEILQHLMNGSSNKVIARELNISEATVKVHLKALLRKMRVNNRTQAAVWALNNGVAGAGETALA